MSNDLIAFAIFVVALLLFLPGWDWKLKPGLVWQAIDLLYQRKRDTELQTAQRQLETMSIMLESKDEKYYKLVQHVQRTYAQQGVEFQAFVGVIHKFDDWERESTMERLGRIS